MQLGFQISKGLSLVHFPGLVMAEELPRSFGMKCLCPGLECSFADIVEKSQKLVIRLCWIKFIYCTDLLLFFIIYALFIIFYILLIFFVHYSSKLDCTLVECYIEVSI